MEENEDNKIEIQSLNDSINEKVQILTEITAENNQLHKDIDTLRLKYRQAFILSETKEEEPKLNANIV